MGYAPDVSGGVYRVCWLFSRPICRGDQSSRLGKLPAADLGPKSPAVPMDLVHGARLAHLRGVPTVFINGKKMRDRSIQSLEAAIDRELAKAKAAKDGKKGTQ